MIRSLYRNHSSVLSSSMSYHRTFSKGTTTGAISGARTAYRSAECTPFLVEFVLLNL